jgi:hypothetical protein
VFSSNHGAHGREASDPQDDWEAGGEGCEKVRKQGGRLENLSRVEGAWRTSRDWKGTLEVMEADHAGGHATANADSPCSALDGEYCIRELESKMCPRTLGIRNLSRVLLYCMVLYGIAPWPFT